MKFYTVVASDGNTFVRDTSGKMIPVKTGDILPETAIIEKGENSQLVLQDGSQTISINTASGFPLSDLLNNTDAYSVNDPDGSTISQNDNAALEPADVPRANKPSQPVDDEILSDMHKAAEVVELKTLNIDVTAGEPGQGLQRENNTIEDEINGSYTLSSGEDALIGPATGPSVTPPVVSTPAGTIDTTAHAKDDTNTATEDQGPTATSGNVLTNDEANSTVTTLGDIKGQYGTYHMQANGDYTYELNNKNPAVQALAEGATLPDPISYTMTDAAGNTASAQLTTTITGTNDAPVLTVGQTTNITGTLTGVDIDTGDILTFEVVHGVGHYGRLDVDSSTGAYTFVQNTSVAGMSLDSSSGKYSGKDAFEVKVTDNHGGTQSKFITFTSESTLTAPTHLVNGQQVSIPNAHPIITPSVPNQPVVTDTKPTIPNVTVPNGVTIDLAKTSDTGSSDHDKITNNPKPEITGHTDVPFSTVEILENGNVIGNAISGPNGNYSIAVPLPTEGAHHLTAHATGPSITTQVSSSPLKITIDTNATATDDTDTATEDQAPAATSGNVLGNDEAHSTVTSVGNIAGKYGTYHMQANGDYTYDLDNKNPAVQALAVGATLPDPISYAITDAAGNTTTATLTTTITGTNDAPVLSVGQTTNIAGTLTATDVDTGDTHTFAVVNGAGSYGKLTVDPTTGAYTFAQNQSVIGMSLDKTNGKYTGNEVFEVKVTDNHGGTQSKFINFTSEVTLTAPTHTGSSGNQVPTPNVPPILTPAVPNPPVVTDTKPVIASVTVPNAVTIDLSKTTDSGTSDQDKITNNPKPEITGHTDVPFSKVDILEHGKVIGSTISGPNGKYSITEPLTDGVHTLTAQATGPSVTAPVTSSPLAITIDTSIKATDDTDTATEDQAPGATSGNVLGNDDKNSTVTTLGDITGKYGTYHMQANGDYTYDLDNSNPAVQALAVGAKLPDQISYTITDAAGNTATAKLTTTITGTNDTPVLSVGQTTNITGKLTAVDPDTGDTHTFAVVHGAGSYGTLTVDPTTGAYTFAQNQSVIGMSLDKTSGKYTGNEVFEVKVTDNHGGTQRKFINFTSEVTLTAPTHTGSSGNQVPTPNVPPILTPTVPNPPVVTDTKPVITSVTVPNTVTIDLSKTTDSGTSDQDKITNNPKPEITGHTDVPFSKVDILENSKVIGHAFSDKLGNYSIAVPLPTEGAHTLTAQATGPSLTTHVTSSPLAITIDTTAPATDDTNTATEDQAPGATSGNVLGNDDKSSTVTTLGDIKGQYGTYHMQANGDYTYDLDNSNPAVQALAVGATLPDPISYAITDAAGNTATAKLTTTITGTNDAPVLTVGQTTNITGTLTGVDIDTGDILTFEVVHGVGHYGRLDVDSSTGAYTFVQNTSVAGMSLDSSSGKYSGKDAFEVKVTDNHGGTHSKFITFTSESTLTAPTHTGTNGNQVPTPNAHPIVTPAVPNPPVVTDTKPTIPKVTVPNTVTIDLSKTTDSGTSDQDKITNNPKPEITGQTAVPFSTVEILENGNVIGNAISGPNGNYSIAVPLPTEGVHHLTAHATGPSITTQVSSSPLDITIDTTAVAKDDTNTATEDQGPTATSGKVLTNDDTNSTVTTVGDITGKYGTYHMQANGHYTYELNNKNPAVQALAEGAKLPDAISYTMTDVAGNTATAKLTTTITGTNDTPVLSVGQTTNITGTLTAVDIDTGDILTFEVVNGTGSYGKLTVDPTTGAYTFAQNQSVIGMSLDKTSGKYTGNEVFEVKVTDNHGGTQSKFINFTSEVTLTAPTHTGSSGNQVPTPNVPPIVTPAVPNPPVVTDTKPVITSVTVPNTVTIDLSKTTDSGTSDQDKITNNPKPEITGHTDVPFSKVDILEHGNVIGHAFSDKLGNYSIAVPLPTEGAHTLTAQATGPSLTTHVTSSPLAITIDTTALAKDDTNTATEDQAPGATSGNVLTNDDTNSTVTTLGDIKGQYGTYHMQASGDYTYDLDNTNPAVQALAVGATLPDTVNYTMTDAAGNTATAKLTTTITGTNDAPVLTVGQTTNITGTLTGVDIDTGDILTFEVVHGVGHYGRLDVDSSTGAYTFVQNTSVAGMSLDSSSGKYSGKDAFEVKVTDNHGGTQSKFITFTSESTLTAPTHLVNGSQVPIPNAHPVVTPSVPNQPVVTDTKPTIPKVTVPNGVTIDLANTSDTGSSDHDNLTNNPKPEIIGHTDVPFSTVAILEKGKVIGNGVSDQNGHYSIIAPLGSGIHNLTAHATGPSITTQVSSSPLKITIDTNATATDDTDTATEDQAPGATSGDVLANDEQYSIVTSVGNIPGTYGMYHMQANGKYTYDLDNTNPAVQALAEGATLPDPISYTMTDAAGNTATAKLTTTITGTNDTPTLSVGQTSHIAGTLTAVDPDTGDTHTFAVVNGAGSYGTLTVDPSTGAYTFVQNQSVTGMTLDPSGVKYSGENAFEVKVTDNHGATHSKFITFTSESTLAAPTHTDSSGKQAPTPNLPPIITSSVPNQPVVTDTKPVIPNAHVANAVSIDLSAKTDTGISDHDKLTNNPNPEITGKTAVPFSKVDILENGNVIGHAFSDKLGNYSIAVPLPTEGLHTLTAQATGPSLTTSVISAPLAITIDTSINAKDETATTDEDHAASISGRVSDNDDHGHGEIFTATSNLDTGLGLYTLQSDGSYTFTVNTTKTSYLAVGESVQATLTYEVTDLAGNTAQAHLITTIEGRNDAPVLSIYHATEFNKGPISVHDDDMNDKHQYEVTTPIGRFGYLVITPDHLQGHTADYEYRQMGSPSVANMQYDNSKGIYSGSEVFEVKAKDGHGGESVQYITFHIQATVTPSVGGLPPVIHVTYPIAADITTNAPSMMPITPPVNAVTIDLDAKSDSGSNNADKITDITTPEIIGHTDIPNSKVEILNNGTVVATTYSGANGDYSVQTSDLGSAGLHTLTAQASGPSATTPVTSSLAITIDPNAPISHTDDVTIVLEAGSDTGIDAHDNITNDNTPTVAGLTNNPNALVEIIEHGKVIATTTADSTGFYTVDVPALGNGAHSLVAKVTLGTSVTLSATPLNVLIDTTINAADDNAIIDETTTSMISGSVISNDDHAQGETVMATTPLITSHGVYTLDPDGSYTFTIDKDATKNIAAGNHEEDTLTYEITDAAGNTASAVLTTSINADGAMYNIVTTAHDTSDDAPEALNLDINESNSISSFSLPTHDSSMLNLDNVEHSLEITKTTEPDVAHDTLAVVATLISDARENSKNDLIIKAVENKEEKAHVNNPDASAKEHGGDHSDNTHDTSTNTVELAYGNHQPAHNSNEDNDDGTGLT